MLIKNSKLFILILLLLIIALAGFFRLYGLETIPPGIYPDEAINANQAISEPGKIFYPENNGREGLFINLIALSFSVFGISIWSFKIVSAIIGILTVLGLYLLTRELFFQYTKSRFRCIALLSSFFLATSFWHINFSRIGFRAILVPLILTFSFYLLFYGFRTKKTWAFILAGIAFGLGFHTYIAFRLAVLIIPVILLFYWFIYKRQNLQKQFFLFVFCFLFFVFIIAAPIGFYFLENPENFMSRSTGISIFSQPEPIKELGKSLIVHLAMFNIAGDYNWRHNVSGSPVLFWPVGILFLIGIFYSIRQCLISLKKRNWPLFGSHSEIIGYWLLITWWFIMILPGILTYEGIPHCLRCIGAIPPTFIFVGIGGEFLYRNIKKIFKRDSLLYRLMGLVPVLLVICFVFLQFNKYFNLWARNPEVANAFSKECVEIGDYLNSLPKETQKYVIINESGPNLPLPVQSIIFIQRTENKDKETKYIFENDIAKIKTDNKKTIIVLMSYDEKIVNQLKIVFPEGELEEKNKIWSYKPNE